MVLKKYTSPNFNDRKNGVDPSMLVLHYTGMRDAKSALSHLCDPSSQVSAHYVIEENGDVHQLVADEKRAWHAGVSYWRGERDINSASIGIEIVNPGHEFGYREFPEGQMLSVIKICRDLMRKYDIPAANVLGHSDVAITRKIDPGHLFPWRRLAEIGIGLWPDPGGVDRQSAEDMIVAGEDLKSHFVALGYDPEKSLPEIFTAFHRHYAPEKFMHYNDAPDKADATTIAQLLSLVRLSSGVIV